VHTVVSFVHRHLGHCTKFPCVELVVAWVELILATVILCVVFVHFCVANQTAARGSKRAKEGFVCESIDREVRLATTAATPCRAALLRHSRHQRIPEEPWVLLHRILDFEACAR
jgi:hypothetical protein